MKYILAINLLLPVVMFILIITKKIAAKKYNPYVFIVVLLTSFLTIISVFLAKEDVYYLVTLSTHLEIAFQVDGLSKIFALLISILWPITTIYAYEYMKESDYQESFYAFFVLTYAVVLGLAFSANFFTLYIFYEFLTLTTIPLVMVNNDSKARFAGKRYIAYMFFGASFAFVGLIFVLNYGDSLQFIYGGVMNENNIAGKEVMLRIVYLITFIGFGVKAAIFPFHDWLPKASVAPTPVTALLHAVAVVNSGVYAIIRTTYYTFGVDFLKGTYAQTTVMLIAIITILFGSTMALRSQHNKKRLAYSTISNISYMLFGVSLMSPLGLVGALLHMVYHSFIKSTLFFDAGAILHITKREYVFEIEGFAKYMPIVFASMLVSGLALMGVPPLGCFFSKYYLSIAAVESHNVVAYIGIFVIIISVLLTTLYIMEMLTKGYIKSKRTYPKDYYKGVHKANNYMRIPLVLLSCLIIIMSLNVGNIIDMIIIAIGL